MCEFCTEHGEGKAWYLNMHNLSQELLAQDERRTQITEFFQDFEMRAARSLAMLDKIQALPFVPGIVGRVATKRQKKRHFGQVVPIEDVEVLLDQVSSIVRLPCACRSLTTGRKENRYCYGLGIDPTGLVGQFPDFAAHLEWLSREEAHTALRQLDKEGLVHSVWTFGTPFIGGLCNCDQDCMAYRLQVGTGMMEIFFAAEYSASIDWDACRGCKLCRGQCPFGAIRYSATQDKCFVDANLCYGCGICRASCHHNAIRLEPRQRPLKWQRRSAPGGQFRVQVKACTSPLDCRACIDACPQRVFVTVPQKMRTNGAAAADWRVEAVLPARCNHCGACMEVCPENAIAIQ